MKKTLFIAALVFSAVSSFGQLIDVETNATSLILKVNQDNTLGQLYFGKKLASGVGLETMPSNRQAYIANGMKDYFEPALRVLHSDGNPSTDLKYISHSVQNNDDGSVQTLINLGDDQYPFFVDLYYVAYPKENIIKSWSVIKNGEKKPVTLYNYASNMLHLDKDAYYLTDFTGDWAKEVNMNEQKLSTGKRIVDTKLGARAGMFTSPFFVVSMDCPADENDGEVLLGHLAWTGNFRYTFEIDNENSLRVISGINPMASEYILESGKGFKTPEFIFCLSNNGVGAASRSFHDWARKYQLKDGNKDRMTLLNNWEATYFSFNEDILVGLFDDAKKLGVDMFLLDDGWFGNKYPRGSDRQGLGDWSETVEKLPNGVGKLVKEANAKDVKFGIWIEPEMVNPKSELFEKHPDWVINLPNRDDYYFRNQMVLDLSNPKVQDFVFGVVDGLMTKYPQLAYFKWDCNSPITNIYSTHLKDKQSHIYVDYVKGLYAILERIKDKYPTLPMMLCSGGGARCDYEALKYFTDFWASDNTDPVERIFIQWGFSHFFPSKSVSSHITSWGKQPLKFKLDVAMMGKLGFDIKVTEFSDSELELAQSAVKTYKNIKPILFEGDLYRLVSPYQRDHCALSYVSKDKSEALVYAFDIHPRFGENVAKVKLNGLDPSKNYKLTEINMISNAESSLNCDQGIFSGDFLMTVGVDLFSSNELKSHIVKVELVK